MIALFFDEIEKIAKVFKGIIKEKKVRVFSHFDCDGISSAAIMTKALIRENANFSITFFDQLKKENVEKINLGEDETLVFLDFGSGQLDNLSKFFDKTQLFILDHHFPLKLSHINLYHLNPLLFNEEEISASVLTYLFSKFLDKRNVELADLAILGAIGDEMEEGWEFKGLTKKILKEAEDLGKISTLRGIRLYGRNRPIHKALASTFDPFIPEISGSESNAIQFLSEIPIEIKVGEEFRKLKDLSLEEQKKLASAIIIERLKLKEEKSEDIFGNIYLLLDMPEDLQDARELSTLLNACGRMGNPEIGLRICLKDFSIVDKAIETFFEYKKLIGNCLNLINEKNLVKRIGDIVYFIGKDKIPESIVGTLTSILSNSFFSDAKIVVGFAGSEKVKVSARTNEDLNLNEVIRNVVEKIGGEAGGHERAAGAYIKKNEEEKFIEVLKGVLNDKG